MAPVQTRRGFLRGLTTIPLIGGGVTLIGNPTAAAEPVTRALLDSYDTWLQLERRSLLVERYGPKAVKEERPFPLDVVLLDRTTGRTWDYMAANNGGDRFFSWGHRPEEPAPSTRAAIVLSAVGCDWRDAL